MMANDNGDYGKVEQIEKSINWKQSVCSAARKRKNARNKDMKQCVANKEKGPWRKRDPPSDDESHGALCTTSSESCVDCGHGLKYCNTIVCFFTEVNMF